MTCRLLLFLPASSLAMASQHVQPALALQFTTQMHASQGFGHDGDGCVIAEAAIREKPIVSNVWFDRPGQRLAQTNVRLMAVDPYPNLTFIGRYADSPPTEIDINVVNGQFECETEPLPPTFCANGSRVCPQTFGDFGSLNAMTSVLGMNYYNTSLLTKTPEADVWQWEWVNAQLIPFPNGTKVLMNVTRNYTYWVSTSQEADGTRPLLRFQWTQSIPLQPALPVHRDCFLFDYTTDYKAGPIDPARWDAPPGVTCQNGSSSSSSSSNGADDSGRRATNSLNVV